ncbi:Transmembrane emp24 domain containing protein 6 [Dissostichus eleginoides]|uniref:Transmembrane emp24 domain containing protein 6 n=1 Tax=Dissostichus eleginoides TaxID=100907 RepID=A0AAD9BQL3_DISEL|nr:Transmembrane emp24 domain containing protein 6 [Dissostichus eleginoides]
MWRIIPFLFLVFCGPVLGGPQTNLHGNMTDQELLWGTDQYDFSVVVPAAGLECFWHFAHRGERFYMSFMVRPRHERNVSTFTFNASESEVFKKPLGSSDHDVKEQGEGRLF